jgi:diguanylate cyclase (GGDEF)-like protein/PAS domain S-box-containing protein
MWEQFVSNNFRFHADDVQFRRVYIINVSILLIGSTLLFFSIYNAAVTSYYTLAAIESGILVMFTALLYYFQKTSNITVAAHGVLVLLFLLLAAMTAILEQREYALFWIIIFLPLAIFLLGIKRGLLANTLFLSYFTFYTLQSYGAWEPAVFNVTSIINIVFACVILTLLIAYFDLSREEAGRALEQQTRRLEDEHDMLDRYVLVCTTDPDGNITYASKAFCELSGYRKEELIGRHHRILRHADANEEPFQEIRATIDEGKIWQGEIENRTKKGLRYWVHAVIGPIYNVDEKQIGYRAIGEDITDKKRVEELAISDYLTGLFNRVKIDRELSEEIVRATRYGTPFCVILVDLDLFKKVNDTYGHQTGDAVLKQVAKILRKNSRSVDIPGRWGGEEFLIVTPAVRIDQAALFAERLRSTIENHPFQTVKRQTASFGVAEYRKGDSIESLVGRVDEALYRAKANGRNRVET